MPNQCGVVDCPHTGRPQVCPYDSRYHHHGRIHYQNDHPAHPELRFRDLTDQGWLYVCDDHLRQIAKAIESRKEATRA